MRKAEIISLLTHPVFHPTLVMITLLLSGISRFSSQSSLILIASVFIMTCLIPVFIFLMMRRWKVIESLQMDKASERSAPLFVMMLCLYGTITIFNKIPVLALFNFYLSACLVVTTVAFIVSFFWKISLHALGWGCLTAFYFVMSQSLMRLYLPVFIACVLLTGVATSARLKLKSHSEPQIYIGIAIGFFSLIILDMVFL
ncbi:MAG: hypothetical protein ACI358_09675 [Candidatus Limimorpha sp.]